MSTSDDLTLVLRQAGLGSRDAVDRLIPLVYDELRRLAQDKLALERRGHTLQTTALVNEAYVRLIDQRRADWKDRCHFFALAGQAMRRILIDYARRRKRGKRGAGAEHVPLERVLNLSLERPSEQIVLLGAALERLVAEHPEKAKVVELRYFSGFTAEETAQYLGVTTRTVRRYWSFAQAWLYRELTRE